VPQARGGGASERCAAPGAASKQRRRSQPRPWTGLPSGGGPTRTKEENRAQERADAPERTLNGTTQPGGPNRQRRWRRRRLPEGWRIIAGMGQPATTAVDPVIDQTRDLAHVLFGAALVGRDVGFRRYPTDAFRAWEAHALRRGDVGLAAILERLDFETFAWTWAVLVRRLDRIGAPALLEELQKRAGCGV
jgi:hypothetical protein